jgi:hypothetical protein
MKKRINIIIPIKSQILEKKGILLKNYFNKLNNFLIKFKSIIKRFYKK